MRLSSGVVWRYRDFERFREECPGGDPELQRLVHDRLDDDIGWLERLGARVVARSTGNPATRAFASPSARSSRRSPRASGGSASASRCASCRTTRRSSSRRAASRRTAPWCGGTSRPRPTRCCCARRRGAPATASVSRSRPGPRRPSGWTSSTGAPCRRRRRASTRASSSSSPSSTRTTRRSRTSPASATSRAPGRRSTSCSGRRGSPGAASATGCRGRSSRRAYASGPSATWSTRRNGRGRPSRVNGDGVEVEVVAGITTTLGGSRSIARPAPRTASMRRAATSAASRPAATRAGSRRRSCSGGSRRRRARGAMSTFAFGSEFTVGMEEELLLVDPATLELAPVAGDVLEAMHADPGCRPRGLRRADRAPVAAGRVGGRRGRRARGAARRALRGRCNAHGERPASHRGDSATPSSFPPSGTRASPARCAGSSGGRPSRRSTSTSACRTGAAVRAFNALRRHMPLLLGLSANSPWWFGVDSGLASARSALVRAYPGRGIPEALRDLEDAEERVAAMLVVAGVPEPTFLWWDLRLHPAHGTIEVREMDAQSSPRSTRRPRGARSVARPRGAGRSPGASRPERAA